jgi:eukaryotic-like serine/threonine-protein kinase
LFLLMEYVHGCDLSSLVARRGTPSFAKAADYIRQAALGLAYLHERGIVHRDIKPSNLLVDSSGIVKIFDLGLARVPTEGDQSLTALHHETIVGTPDYMAPEQVLECHDVDGRADLYALGGTFYFLLTAHAPFAEGTLARRLLKHQREAPESIYFKRPETPTALVAICRRLLAKRPQDRFASAEELSRTLADWLATACNNADPEAGGRPPRADAQDDFAALARWSGFGP